MEIIKTYCAIATVIFTILGVTVGVIAIAFKIFDKPKITNVLIKYSMINLVLAVCGYTLFVGMHIIEIIST